MLHYIPAFIRKSLFLIIPLSFVCFASQAQDKDKKKESNIERKFGGGPDSTYGKGGRVLIDTAKYKDGSYKVNYGYRDGNGKFRQNTEFTHNNDDGSESTTSEYFDTSGKKTKETSVTKDRAGNTTYTREEDYKDGVLDSGDIYYDVTGVRGKVHKRYNKQTGKYEFVEENGKGNPGDDKNIDPGITSYLFLGGSLISEDNGSSRFNTYGGTVVYNRLLSKTVAVTGEIGAYFGSNNSIHYTKTEFLAGLSIFPHNTTIPFISPHLLMGVSMEMSKYGTIFSSNSNSFTMAAGGDCSFPVSKNLLVNLRADYNPSFAENGVKHDLWFSAGMSYRFYKH